MVSLADNIYRFPQAHFQTLNIFHLVSENQATKLLIILKDKWLGVLLYTSWS